MARSKLPEEYAAMQWRMELMPPKALQDCSDLFAESIISGMREQGLRTIYVASDMPLSHERTKSKSASFNLPEVQAARDSINHLVVRLKEAEFNVKTWNDVKPSDDDEVGQGERTHSRENWLLTACVRAALYLFTGCH